MADLSDQPAFETGGLATCPTAPEAGNQGLEPCKIGFGDQFAPCALPMKWTWRDLNTLPPACKTGALPGELQAHGRSGEFCHPGLLFPKQALFYLSYTPQIWGD